MSADSEPPKYIQSLIGAINDAAKAAQTSALFLLAPGLYLVATVISTTDEDLLRGTAVQVAQLGVRTPVAIAYALAPVIFLFLHVHTLIRFDMLAANLRLLTAELAHAAPLAVDRERCRALLANVEFVQFMAAPPGSSFRSPLFRFMTWLIVSGLPFGVLLAVQISFLRYQSEAITMLHQVCLVLDFSALLWFRTRLWLAGRKRRVIPVAVFSKRMSLSFAMASLVLTFAVVYAGVPSAKTTTVGWEPADDAKRSVHRAHHYEGLTAAMWSALKGAASQPLDLAACPWLNFGCRFLRLDHRTLLANTPPAPRTGKSDDLDKDLAQIEGLFLRGRTLRFADFTESRLYAADLMRADLHGASLVRTRAPGVILSFAQLQDANFSQAELQSANFGQAELQGATLSYAQLYGADLVGAQLHQTRFTKAALQGANLEVAELQGAILVGAQLQGANLLHARLRNADLTFAQLQGAALVGAQLQSTRLLGAGLQGARLFAARMQGADLRGARLEGSILEGVWLQGADLRGAHFWKMAFSPETNLGFADLRGASWRPPDENEKTRLRDIVDGLPVRENWQRDSKRRLEGVIGSDWQRDRKVRLERLIASDAGSDEPPVFGLDGLLLVDDVDDPRWQRLVRSRLTSDERAYDEALVPFLADLARSDPDVARGLASRIGGEVPSRAERLAGRLLDRAGPALPDDGRQRLSTIASGPIVKD